MLLVIYHISFQLTAKDLNETTLNDTCEIFLNITNMNDNYPQFNKSTFEISIDEELPVGSSVITIEVTGILLEHHLVSWFTVDI